MFFSKTQQKLPDPLPAIWLIEDNYDDVLYMNIVLEELRLQNPLHISRDEQEAKQIFTNYQAGNDVPPGVIFIDVNLPCADGFDLLTNICKEPCFEHSIKVIMSGGYTKGDEARSAELGADFYLTKPFHFNHLETITAGSSKLRLAKENQQHQLQRVA